VRINHRSHAPRRFARCALSCTALLIAALAAAQAPHCRAPAPCDAAEFVTQLLKVADETQTSRLPADFSGAFGTQLARHTRVLISGPIEGAQKNGVACFVRLGDEGRPLRFGAGNACVTLAALERGLTADGWVGGRTGIPGREGHVLRYLKGSTQLTAAPAPAGAAGCAASILITFRAPRAAAVSP
jgi:hypothetical protein